nr:uncharacterized protein LOC109154352 isoform X2 [Ipomoea trifida]
MQRTNQQAAPHGEVPAVVHGEVLAAAVPAPVVVPLAPVVPAPVVVPLAPVIPAAIVVPVAPTSYEVAHEEIPPFPAGDENSQLPTIETQVDHLLSVGDSVHKVIDDLNSQVTDVGLHGIESHNTVGEGMMTTSHGVKISFGQPAKRRKTTSHARKGKEVVDSAPPTKPKKQKHLGITKSWTARARKYMTRSSTMFRMYPIYILGHGISPYSVRRAMKVPVVVQYDVPEKEGSERSGHA